MTFPQAIQHLQNLAVDGSADLVPAVGVVDALKPCSVYRMIERQQIPAVKVAGTWKTTRALFVLFWKRTMVPTKESQTIRLSTEQTRRQQIEAAREMVLKGSAR